MSGAGMRPCPPFRRVFLGYITHALARITEHPVPKRILVADLEVCDRTLYLRFLRRDRRDHLRIPYRVPRRFVIQSAHNFQQRRALCFREFGVERGHLGRITAIKIMLDDIVEAIQVDLPHVSCPHHDQHLSCDERAASGLIFPGSCFHRNEPNSRSHAQMYEDSARKKTMTTCLLVAENSMPQSSQSVKLSWRDTGHVVERFLEFKFTTSRRPCCVFPW